MLPETTDPPKRRGAPRGNTNALKHGFYSRRFKRLELNDLEKVDGRDLEDEIAMLRVIMRRLIELSPEDMPFAEGIKFLRVISIASANLSRLMRAQQVIAATGSFIDPFYETLAELNAEDQANLSAGGN